MKVYAAAIEDQNHYFSKNSTVLIISVTFTILFTLFFISNVKAEKGHSTTLPQLTVQENMYDFGLAVEGEKVIHDFVLQNKGTSVLEIKKVKTG